MTGRPIALHLTNSLDFGGVETRLVTTHRAASVAAKFNHHFCAIGAGGASAETLCASGACLEIMELRTRIPSIRTINRLVSFLQELRPQVIHCHGAEANFHGLVASFLARVPVRIGEEIGIPNHSPTARRVFCAVYKTAHRVIAISDAVRDHLVKTGEVPASKAVRIYNPVEVSPPLPLIVPTGVLRIGFVGRLEPVKNPQALVEAVAHLAGKGIVCELWLIGEGSLRPTLELQVKEAGLVGRVTLWGYQAAPAELLRRCHVYVQPSLAEGFGIALVEAMQCGLPVIATQVGGAREIIQDKISGWLVEPHAVALATSLAQAFAAGSDRLAEMGKEGRASVRSRFEPAAYLRQLEALYSSLLVA